jgi:glycosyltransferase involved in cell wall biosynthesis
MARILVLGVKVPFTHGGQEVLVSTLVKKLSALGHEADVIELPYNPLPKEQLMTQVAMWRALDLTSFAGKPIDLVIATKFPSYYVRHPRKSVWLVHQLRSIYDLYGGPYSDFGDDPRDEDLRRMLVEGDVHTMGECVYRAAISKNVADRLALFNGLSAEVLYPPLPLGTRYYSGATEPYILSVGRICRIKRVDMLINAMPMIDAGLKLKIVGAPDEPGIMEWLGNEIRKHDLASRIEFLGKVSDEALLDLYAKATAVYYAPFNEDYGYVTLEAMASNRPLITASDSGGTLEFVRDGETGCIVEPRPEAVAAAINNVARNPEFAATLGRNGRRYIDDSGMATAGWDAVVDGLLSPLRMRNSEMVSSEQSVCHP